MNFIKQTQDCIDRIREITNTAILFCSFGKDSLVLLDMLSKKFDKVICIFMYFVKDLEHIDKYIRWAKAKYPNIEVEQMPHWNLTYILKSGMYCVPNPKIKLLKLNDIIRIAKKKHQIPYVFLGMKKADGLNRRLMLKTYDNYENKGNVYPLSDWSQKNVLTYIKQYKIPSPVRYSKNVSGGCGFNIDCYLFLQRHYPNDLQKILKAFPMSKKILIDHETRHNTNRNQNDKTFPN